INPHLGARRAAGRDGQIEAVKSFSLSAKVTCRASTENGGNLAELRIVVRIILLIGVDESFATRHEDAFVLGAVIEIVGVLNARQGSDHAACGRVKDRERSRFPRGYKEAVVGLIESHGKILPDCQRPS